MSTMMKSTGKTNLLTFTSIFSTIPCGYLIGRVSKLNTHLSGSRFPLAPRSAEALLTERSLIKHGIVKLPESTTLGGNLFYKTAEHSSFKVTVDRSSNFFLLESKFFRNLAYERFGYQIRGVLK
ncbi:hypothetical protein Hanom_Chr10g00893131 [Helianthus anomalus]